MEQGLELTKRELKEIFGRFIGSMPQARLEELYSKASASLERREEEPLKYYKPHRIQKMFHDSNALIRALFGANASGKTFCGAKETATFLLGYDPSGTTKKNLRWPPHVRRPGKPVLVWVCGEDFAVCRGILLPELLNFLPDEFVLKWDAQNHILFCKDGSEVHFHTFDQHVRKWQSAKPDFAWVDEQPPHPHWKELMARVGRRMGYLILTMTPLYAHSAWTHEDIVESDNPNIEWFNADIEDNIYLTTEMKKWYYDAYVGTDDEGPRLHGDHQTLMGRVHKPMDKHIHVLEKPLTHLEMIESGFEFSRVIDLHQHAPCVCNWFAFRTMPNPVLFVIDDFNCSTGIRDFAEGIIAKTGKIQIKYNVVDHPEAVNTKNTITMKTQLAIIGREKGHNLSGPLPSRATAPAIERTNDYLRECRLLFFPNCRDTIRSMHNLVWKTWKGTYGYENNPKETYVESGDHWVRNVHFQVMKMPSINLAREKIIDMKKHRKRRNRRRNLNYDVQTTGVRI